MTKRFTRTYRRVSLGKRDVNDGNRWKGVFGGAWLGTVVLTAAAGRYWLAGSPSLYAGLGLALAGELLLGVSLFLVAGRLLVRPAARRPDGLPAPGEGSDPRDAGAPASPADGVPKRPTRDGGTPRDEVRVHDEDRRRADLLRREFGETKAHLEAKIHDLHSIYEVSTAVAGILDLDELFRVIPERVRETLGLKDFCLFLYDPERRALTCRASAGMPAEAAAGLAIVPGEGIPGRVFQSGEAAYVPDVRSSSELVFYGGRRIDVRSFMCVPLMSKGRVIGVLNVNHPEPSAFDAESLATMRVLATHVAIAIENAELFRFLRTLAEKDSLTLLYNHGAFHEKLHVELERASRYGHPMAVMMLDLDCFKDINDRHGHTIGDRILVMTAGVLCAHLRKIDIPARYGGDEFAVILPETDLGAAGAIASRIVTGISQVRAETEKGEVISFSVSIGYAACRPASENRGSILDVADRLMYESKRRGRGGILGEQI